jgi:hypothetical protein
LGKVKAMPDQSSASTEHALLQEITAPLDALPDDPLPLAADVEFPIVLRGYDRLAVDAYVKKTSQLVAELQATRSPEAAVRRALERVGEEVSGILQRAHDTAERITAQSRSEAEDRLESARLESTSITAEADKRVRDMDAETDRIWAERHRIVEDARELARALIALAESAVERFPPADEAEAGTDTPAAVAEQEGLEVAAEMPAKLDRADELEPETARDAQAGHDAAAGHEAEAGDDEPTVLMPPLAPEEDSEKRS